MSKEKDKGGRPKIEINWDILDQYLEAGASGVKAAAALGVHYHTLISRFEERQLEGFSTFSQYIQAKRSKGDVDLLMKQHELALEGDKTMLVWKGKSRLKQIETKEVKHSGNVMPNITITPASKKEDESDSE